MKTEEEIREKLESLKKEGLIVETKTQIMYQKGYLNVINALEWVLEDKAE